MRTIDQIIADMPKTMQTMQNVCKKLGVKLEDTLDWGFREWKRPCCLCLTKPVMEATLPETPDHEAIPLTEDEANFILNCHQSLPNTDTRQWYIIRHKTTDRADLSPFWKVYDKNYSRLVDPKSYLA
jgi:hypothetical protein